MRNDEQYHARFRNFDKFYHSLVHQPYPLQANEQGLVFLFPEAGLQFLALNSSWEIDEFFKDRSSVNDSAFSRALLKAARARLNEPLFWPVAADGQALPFRDANFDCVICQLGLQFFPDPSLGLAEFRRVLRNSGRVAVCVISSPDRAPMWSILADAISRFRPTLRNILYLSFSLGDHTRLEALLGGAGLREVRVERETREAITESFDKYWEPIEAGIGSIPQSYLTLSDEERRAVREEVRDRLSRFESDGKLLMSVEMLIGRGRA